MKLAILFRAAGAAMIGLICTVPLFASAQMMQYSQLVVTTRLAGGVTVPTGALPLVTVTATGPSFFSVPNTYSPTLAYTSGFANDTRTVTFTPGSYTVVASGAGYYFAYSPDCSGFTPNGMVKSCTITLSTTPPPSDYACSGLYGGYGCTYPVVPYSGPIGQSQITCSPAYQTVGAGQAVTVTAAGGSVGYSNTGYSWTTPDRTYLNIGPVLSTMFQNSGVQTVVVNSGVGSATCTVNVLAGVGPINYVGTTPIVSAYTATIVPALPNTGFAPGNGAAVAFAAVLILAVGFVVLPYVRKTAFACIR